MKFNNFIKTYNLKHFSHRDLLLHEISLRNFKENFYPSNLRYFKKSNVLWTKIQKNASSTIFLSLSSNENINFSHIKNPSSFQNIMGESNKDIHNIPENFTNIICFREPRKRIVSLFLDKCVNNCYTDELSIRFLRKINKDLGKITFRNFLEYMHASKHSLNKIWKDQSSYILFNYYDYIFDVDSLRDTWMLCQLHPFLYHSTSNKEKLFLYDISEMSILDFREYKNYSIDCACFFKNKEIEELFEEVYKQDIELYEHFFPKTIK